MLLSCHDLAVPSRLAPVSADVTKGELIHLLGPNGAGKSTLLAALAGLLPAEGEMLFAGRPLAAWSAVALSRRRAFLHQQAPKPDMMPVWHYLSLHQPADAPQRDDMLSAICQRFQLEDKLARPLYQLSGGEWQRVRLAAVFCQISQPEGQLLLLDEPLTGLDLAQQAAFDAQLAALVATGITAIVSGHDINHTLHHARSVWLMKEGTVIAPAAPPTRCSSLNG